MDAENLKVKTFQDQIVEDLQARDEKAKKLDEQLKSEADPVEVVETALEVISAEQDIILALSHELRDEKSQPVRFQERLDQGLIAEIQSWKQRFETLQMQFQQFRATHF